MITRRASIVLMGATALALSVARSARATDLPHPITADWTDPLFAAPFVVEPETSIAYESW